MEAVSDMERKWNRLLSQVPVFLYIFRHLDLQLDKQSKAYSSCISIARMSNYCGHKEEVCMRIRYNTG